MGDTWGGLVWLIYAVIVVVPTALLYRARNSTDRASSETEKDHASKQMTHAAAFFAVAVLGSFLLAAVLVMTL